MRVRLPDQYLLSRTNGKQQASSMEKRYACVLFNV